MSRSFASFATCMLLVAATSGCPSYTAVPEHQRIEIAKDHAGEMRWLKQSMYVGMFYDDDRYELVSAQPFERITVLRSLDGEVIPPPSATEILPAGTRVRIERIAFPTGREVFRRPLYTPRYTTWVVMRVAASRGDTRLERSKRHILLLPTFLKDDQEFDLWLDASLSDEDPNPWLRSLTPGVREAVFDKRPAVGMTYEALTAALGYPDSVARDLKQVTRAGKRQSVTVEVAIYGATSVVLEQGIVVRIADPSMPVAPSVDVKPAPTPVAVEEPAPPEADIGTTPDAPTEVLPPKDDGGAGPKDGSGDVPDGTVPAAPEAADATDSDAAESDAIESGGIESGAIESETRVPPVTPPVDGSAASPTGDLLLN